VCTLWHSTAACLTLTVRSTGSQGAPRVAEGAPTVRSTGFRVRIRRQEHRFKVFEFEADVLLAEIGHSCSDGGGGEGVEECSNDNGKFHDDIFRSLIQVLFVLAYRKS
jgi:hypothetical protein